MAKTDTKRLDDLETRVADLEQRPTEVAAGITAGNLSDRVNQEVGPLNNAVQALKAIVQAYETLLLARGVIPEEIAKAAKASGQKLTDRQWDILRDLLQSV